MANFLDPKNHTEADLKSFELAELLFNSSEDSLSDKIDCFSRFASRKSLARFLVRYELIKQIINVNGSVLDCGVLSGQGLFTFAKVLSMLEPYNHTRKVIGFDTFEGFPHIDKKDTKNGLSSHFSEGSLKSDSYDNLLQSVDLFDSNRPLNHINKIELVKGDICDTASDYVKNNPHLIVSLLYLDLDLYKPTLAALKAFVPLMPKGGLIVFDEDI